MQQMDDGLTPEGRLGRDLGAIFGAHLESLQEWYKKFGDPAAEAGDPAWIFAPDAYAAVKAIFADTYVKLKNLGAVYELPSSEELLIDAFRRFSKSDEMISNLQLASYSLAIERPELAVQASHAALSGARSVLPGADFKEFSGSIEDRVILAWAKYVAQAHQPGLDQLIQRRMDGPTL